MNNTRQAASGRVRVSMQAYAHAHESWGEFMFVRTAVLDATDCATWTFVCHHDPLLYLMCLAIQQGLSRSGCRSVMLVACTCTACNVLPCAFPHLVNSAVVQSKTQGSSLETGTRNG